MSQPLPLLQLSERAYQLPITPLQSSESTHELPITPLVMVWKGRLIMQHPFRKQPKPQLQRAAIPL